MSVGKLSEHVLFGGLWYPQTDSYIEREDGNICGACLIGGAVLSLNDAGQIWRMSGAAYHIQRMASQLWPWLLSEVRCPRCQVCTDYQEIISSHLGTSVVCGRRLTRPEAAAYIREWEKLYDPEPKDPEPAPEPMPVPAEQESGR